MMIGYLILAIWLALGAIYSIGVYSALVTVITAMLSGFFFFLFFKRKKQKQAETQQQAEYDELMKRNPHRYNRTLNELRQIDSDRQAAELSAEVKRAEQQLLMDEYELSFRRAHPDAPPDMVLYWGHPPTKYPTPPDDIHAFVAYDLETTGLNPEKHQIVEIAAIKTIGGEVVDEFHALVNPGAPIPARATEINGITDEMVAECRTISEVLPDFMAFIGRYPLVAHNAEFDYDFVKAAHLKTTGKEFKRRHYCTMKLYRRHFYKFYREKPDSSRLEDVVLDVLGSDYRNEFIYQNHRATIDAKAVNDIFLLIGGVTAT